MDTVVDDPPLQLVFRGECLEGHDPAEVRLAIALALKLDPKRTERLFSGRRVVVRRQVDVVTAHRYIARFAMLGAVLLAEPQDMPPGKAAPVPAPPPAAEPSAAPAAAAPAAASPAARRWRLPTLPSLPAWRPRWRWPSRPAVQAPPDWPYHEISAPVRWARRAVIGVGCVVGGLLIGVLAGPGIRFDTTPAPVAAPTGAAAPLVGSAGPALALAEPDPAVPQEPAPAPAPGAETIPPNLSNDARRAFETQYRPAPSPKVLVVSSGGAYGWASGPDAAQRALARCNAERPTTAPPCVTVNVDGHWVQ